MTGGRRSRVRGAAPVVGLVALVVVLAACTDDTPNALDPQGDDAKVLADTWWYLFAVATAVFVIVAGLIGVALGRRRGGADESDGPTTIEPARTTARRDHAVIAVGGVAVPAVILAITGVIAVGVTAARLEEGPDPLVVHVTGRDWFWDVSYPESGVVTANEIHVPVGRQVRVELDSADVIHSFWVPQLAGKVDLIPGQTNTLRFTADAPGTYRGQCAEYCGIQHAHMAFHVVAQTPEDFAAWLEARRSPPPAPPPGSPEARGREAFLGLSCAGCHRIAGTTADGEVGPDLSDVGSRSFLGAGTLPNTPANLADWMRDAQAIKPGSNMPPIDMTDEQVASVVAYLESLP